ncbi:MAG: 1-deoxy-D-xylulose-5-phosphate reductoisomerase [Muribaculaceae bacterium]|nr:1-deoxy-D-xylulose-5-phosphate reductoisomerase [Muribaculaceae bacterium]
MEQRRNIAILGSTGSIGRQTLDILAEYPTLFRPWLLTAHRSTDLLIEQARQYSPAHVVIADEACYEQVRDALADTAVTVHGGSAAIAQLVTAAEVHTVVTAMVGYSGLESTIAAISAGKDIALANKETLVVAGELITHMLTHSPSHLYPVDSEHGAFYQCLMGERMEDVSKLILTASGGPFRTVPRERLATVKASDALKHPNWAMGAKITIDSATMMNKGFEMLEAKWLFNVGHERIEIVVHPQSIVHSMVEFVDGSVKAQLGLPDMHIPIRYALGLPTGRLATNDRRMTIDDYAQLTFERPDFEKFPLLARAYEAAERGGNAACAMNAANEVAVAAFLRDEISFTQIHDIVAHTMQAVAHIHHPTYDDLVATNAEARKLAEQWTMRPCHQQINTN